MPQPVEQPVEPDPGPPITVSFTDSQPGCGGSADSGSNHGRLDPNQWFTPPPPPEPGSAGFGWFQHSRPVLLVDNNGGTWNRIRIKFGARKVVDFRPAAWNSSGVWIGVNGAQGVVTLQSGSRDTASVTTLKYYDDKGNIWTFFGPPSVDIQGQGGVYGTYGAGGQLWKVETADGSSSGVIAHVGHPTDSLAALTDGFEKNTGNHPTDRVTGVYNSAGGRRMYYYSMLDSTNTKSLITAISVQVDTDPGTGVTWTEAQKHEYDYYGTGNSNGAQHDLRMVTVTTPLTSGGNDVRRTYYRYGAGSSEHLVTLEVGPEGMRQLNPSTVDSMSLNDILPYASRSWTYDCKGRVKEMLVGSACGCSNTGLGLYKFSHEINDGLANASKYNVAGNIGTGDWGSDWWSERTYITYPNGLMSCIYYDLMGWEIGRVVSNQANQASPFDPATNQLWITKFERDCYGRKVREYTVDAVNALEYIHGPYIPNPTTCTFAKVNVDSPKTAGTIVVKAAAGLVRNTVYRAKESNGENYLMYAVIRKSVQKGKNGSPITLEEWDYISPADGVRALDVAGGDARLARAFPTAHRVFRESSGADESAYSYVFHSDGTGGLPDWQPKSVVTTLPALASGDTSGPATVTKSLYLDRRGRTVLTKDGEGVWTFTAYNIKGLVSKSVEDPDDADANAAASSFNVSIGTGLNYATQYGYDISGRLVSVTLPSGRVVANHFTKLSDGRLVTLTVPSLSGTTATGPVEYQVHNLAGNTVAEGVIGLPNGQPTSAMSGWINSSGSSDVIGAVSVGSVQQLTVSLYDTRGDRLDARRTFHTIPTSYASAQDSQYDETLLGYTASGKLARVKDPTGTITRLTYDLLNRVVERWVGTNDNGFSSPSGESSGTANMSLVETVTIDAGNPGPGLVTQRILRPDTNSANNRMTTFTYDWRKRLIVQENALPPHRVFGYDNAGHVVGIASYSNATGLDADTVPSQASAARIDYAERIFNTRGQLKEAKRHKITQSGGSAGASTDTISSKRWFDGEGRLVKTAGAEVLKSVYDSLGREIREYVIATDGGDSTFDHAKTVDGANPDTVLEERQYLYDNTNKTGTLTMSVEIERNPLDTSTTGSLDTDSSMAVVDPANLKGRAQISAYFYDSLDRLANSVSIGNIGSTTFNRGNHTDTSTLPSGSLIAVTSYWPDGELNEVTDPKGVKAKYYHDAATRRTKSISNYVNGTPGPDDDDQVIEYGYTNGLMTSLAARMASSSDDQVTTYTYGVTPAQTPASTITSNRLLQKVAYPDSATSDDVVRYAYNALGEIVAKKDQNGVVISKSYDKLGRETARSASVPSTSGIDTAVLRIAMAYQSRGAIDTVTQYDAATGGNVVDEVKFSYDEWGNLSEFRQDVDSVVESSSGSGNNRGSFGVAYLYAKAPSTTGRSLIRRTQAQFKAASAAFRTINYGYGSNNSIADHASRVATVSVGSATVASYDYLGSDHLVGTMLDQPDVSMRLFSLSGTTYSYPGLDQHDRPTRWDWKRMATSGGSSVYDYSIAYDANSNPTSTIDNLTERQLGANAGKHLFDVIYGLDDLNRVISAEEGHKSGSSILSGYRTRQETWPDLSPTGNWQNRFLDANGDGDYTDADDRDEIAANNTFNKANEWTARRVKKSPSTNYDDYSYTYDPAGNLVGESVTKVRAGSGNQLASRQFVYDAFGRLVKVVNPMLSEGGEDRIAQYKYNGLGFRTMAQYDEDVDGVFEASERVYFAYDERWRMIASFRNQDANPKEAFVYHAAGKAGRGGASYIDSVILRDRNTTGGWTGSAGTTLDERRFYLQNWRADVIAVIKDDGDPVEYVRYSSYGEPIVYPVADVNRDGIVGGADSDDFYDLFTEGNSSWNRSAVSIDLNRNGTLFDDDTLFNESYLANSGKSGAGRLSHDSVLNRKGYAGYEWDPFVGVFHVRHRAYLPQIGRWSRRDPIYYAGGTMNLYKYVNSMPIALVDSQGLLPEESECTTKSNGKKTTNNRDETDMWFTPYGRPPSIIQDAREVKDVAELISIIDSRAGKLCEFATDVSANVINKLIENANKQDVVAPETRKPRSADPLDAVIDIYLKGLMAWGGVSVWTEYTVYTCKCKSIFGISLGCSWKETGKQYIECEEGPLRDTPRLFQNPTLEDIERCRKKSPGGIKL